MREARRAVVAVTILLVAGCGARTGLLVDAPADAGVDAEVEVDADLTPVSEPARVAVGQHHSCAIIADGTAWCWGRNDSGQLGIGTTEERHVPTRVVGLTHVAGLAGDHFATCGWLEDGSLWCWGANNTGRLGDGTLEMRTEPVRIERFSGVRGMSRGGDVLVWLGDGALWRLGWGGEEDLWVHVAGLDRIAGASSGGHSGEGGSAWAWLDDGTAIRPDLYEFEHETIEALLGVAGITDGETHTCAWLDDGSAWCWGRNEYGQLGDGTRIERLEPTRVADLAGVVGMTAGELDSCAWLGDGSAWCWGNNGSGTLHSSLVPARVVGLEGVVAMATRGGHTCASVLPDEVWCWGSNSHGQLGTDSHGSRGAPVQARLPGP